MIEVCNISFAYPHQPLALDSVSFQIPTGQTVGLVGANGSGKSTLLTLLAGLHAPQTGTIRIGSYSSPGQEKQIRALAGLVLQEADLQILGLTVGEDLCLGQEGADAEIGQKCRDLARRFGLGHLWDRPVEALSWGQKRRLCLAAILSKNPRVLLLDEPFIGLDYEGVNEMRAILAENKRHGLTQVIATHNLEPLSDLVDHWLVLWQGEMTVSGGSRAVFEHLRKYSIKPPCACHGDYAA